MDNRVTLNPSIAMGNQSPRWYLTGRATETASTDNFDIDSSPFRIGRQSGASLTLPRLTVSSVHAEILVEQDSLLLRDLNSTNGTLVNGHRVTKTVELQEGDVIQFADVPFQLNRMRAADPQSPVGTLASQFFGLLKMATVTPHYQPIVAMRDKAVTGYEILARSQVSGLHTANEMFLVASQLNVEDELSRMLRLAGFQQGIMTGQMPSMFVNTHPTEVVTQDLLDSLRRIRDISLDQPVTVEICEPTASNTTGIKRLREALSHLGIQLAYDKFGVGRSRSTELAAVQPDIVKFDMNLIRDIHLATAAQQTMLANLVRMVKNLGIIPLAMGVESEAEHIVCCEIGFELGQGYLYGKPVPKSGIRPSYPSLAAQTPRWGSGVPSVSGGDIRDSQPGQGGSRLPDVPIVGAPGFGQTA